MTLTVNRYLIKKKKVNVKRNERKRGIVTLKTNNGCLKYRSGSIVRIMTTIEAGRTGMLAISIWKLDVLL